MNRQQRRTQGKTNRPKQYTAGDIERKVREAAKIAAKYNIAQTISCALLTLHRKHGWSASQCLGFMEDLDALALECFSVWELTEAVKDELGFDIIEEAEERLML